MDKTLNDLLDDKNDFGFCDEADKISSSMENSDVVDQIIPEEEMLRDQSEESQEFSTKSFPQDEINSLDGMEYKFAKLEKSLNLFKNLPELKVIEKYSLDLKKKIDYEIEELDLTMAETKATIVRTQRLKKQRYYVKKELTRMTTNLAKVKQEELQEMELVVAVYDKDLLRRWHVAKKTNSPHALEGFINNIIGKRQALDNVYKMAKDRLESLKKTGPTPNLPAIADQIIIKGGILLKSDETFFQS